MDRMRRHTKATKEPRVERREKGGEEKLAATSLNRSGFRCGGDGGEFDEDGHDAPCAGGGGGGGGRPASVTGFNNGVGGNGGYGGGGGGGGVHPSPMSLFDFQSPGGKGGFGGGGGAGSAGRTDWGDNGGTSEFGGGGGGAGKGTPGDGGTFGGNGAAFYGGGAAALGGAIFSHFGTVTVQNSTFSGNYVLHGYARRNFRAGGSRSLRRTVRMPAEPSSRSAARSPLGTQR
jgi:hypothetical protein